MQGDGGCADLTMKIQDDADIPMEKLTRYLLVPRPWDDKSKFLGQGGFDLLLRAIRAHAAAHEAVEDGDNPYGQFLRVEGDLTGANGNVLRVVTIWIEWHIDRSVHFVTLKPWRS